MSPTPWHIEKRDGKHCVIKDDDGSTAGCHASQSDAEAQMKALYAQEGSTSESLPTQPLPEQPSDDAPPSDAPTYAMVALVPPADVATQLVVEGGEAPEELHVTLIYLGPNAVNELDRLAVEQVVTQIASAATPISGVYGGIGIFPAENEDTRTPDEAGQVPVVALLDAVGLAEFRVALMAAMRETVDFPADTHGWCAHTTLIYAPSDNVTVPPAPNVEVTFPEVYICWGDYLTDPSNLTKIPLGPAVEPASKAPPEMMTAETQTWQIPGGALTFTPIAYSTTATNGTVTLQTVDESPVPDPSADVPAPETTREPEWEALVVRLDTPTDDGRMPTELTWREPPFAAEWNDEEGEFHDGAKRFGTTTKAEIRNGNEVWLSGIYIDSETGAEVRRLADQGEDVCAAGWPSVTVASPLTPDDIDPEADPFEMADEEIQVNEDGTVSIKFTGKIVGWGLFPIQAQDGTLFRNLQPAMPIAASIPVAPPAEWFSDPNLSGPTPLTVTDEGQVFGHFGVWDGPDSCYTGKPGCVRPPRTQDTSYSRFRCGHVMTAEGVKMSTGSIVLTGGHRDLHAIAAGHADTRTGIADVIVGEDRFGPWVAGALRPGTPPEDVRRMRGSALSGEWYGQELLGITCVNRPAFLVRSLVAAAGDVKAMQTVGPSPEDDMDQEMFDQMHAAAHAAEIAAHGAEMGQGGEEPVPEMMSVETLEVIGATDLPIADRDTSWDGSAAGQRVADACGGTDNLDPTCYSRAFLWRDPTADPKTVGAYKLGFADMINSKLQIVPKGVFACTGSHGVDAADIPAADKERIRGKLNSLYAAMAKKFADDTIVPPWEQASAIAAAADGGYRLGLLDSRVLGDLDRRVMAGLDRRVG